MGKRSGNFLTGTCTQVTIRYGKALSLRSEFCSSLLEGWEWGAWQTPSSGQTPNCVKLLRWRFFHSFCVPALVLGLLPLSDARQRINLELWLGLYGLVGEWVVTGCVQRHPPPPTFPCEAMHVSAKNLVLRCGWVCTQRGVKYKYIN